jgi:PBP1b-binding outer membrane lipoprotein LpoB
MNMNRSILISVLGGIALVFGGCASQQNATSANSNPTAKSYSSNDLQKTGKRTAGEALQAADPAVTARGGN